MICEKTFNAKWMGEQEAVQKEFFVGDIGERVFGSVMANYVDHWISINYFSDIISISDCEASLALLSKAPNANCY